jgi:hypothetical protein
LTGPSIAVNQHMRSPIVESQHIPRDIHLTNGRSYAQRSLVIRTLKTGDVICLEASQTPAQLCHLHITASTKYPILSELTASFNNLTMADTQYAILVLVPAIIAGLYFLLHQWRHKAFAHIPSPLKRNLFLGHLGYIGEEQQKLETAHTTVIAPVFMCRI